MSLITDALQKVQRPPAFEPLTPNPPPPRRPSSWWPTALALGLLGLGLIWLWPSHRAAPRHETSPAPAAASHPMTEPIMALVGAGPTTPAMTWRINGVIIGLGKPSAIINGKLVEEGEELHGGAKVVRVNADRVELSHNGETIEVPVEPAESR